MKRYEAYKDSGVDWIGEIPEHWECKRLGSWFTERREKVSDKDFEPLSVTKNGIVPQLETTAKSNDGDNRKGVRSGDFVINSRSDRKGSSGLAKMDGSVSLINIVMKPRNINGYFSEFLLKSNSFIEEFYRNGHGIVADLWTTRFEDMKFINIPVPPFAEQTAIAEFLDDKTAKIDQLIGIKQKEIELLKERRQILIQKAVTKGLDDTVKLKDSGVDWIGEIPEHWEVTPGRTIFKERKESNKGLKNSIVLSLSYGKIIIKPEEKMYGLVPESFETYQLVYEGDIIVRGTDLQNDKTSLRTGLSHYNGIITSAYLNLIVKNSSAPSFIQLFLYVMDISKEIYKYGSGLRQNLSFNDFKLMPILDVPLDEQIQIVSYLEEIEEKIAKAILLKQQEIEKLKEYKTVLIDQVVTGKVKVMGNV